MQTIGNYYEAALQNLFDAADYEWEQCLDSCALQTNEAPSTCADMCENELQRGPQNK